MAATSPTAASSFYKLWRNERIRETLWDHLSQDDICSVRLANSACCNLVTKRLFLRTQITFTATTFTKPTRVQALSRVGHHIEHLTFFFPHSDATFLPPLIHPQTGQEICFLYRPHTSMASVLERPKYANSELGEILTRQYPPLFHAASNVPSFINALKYLTNMRHLTIKTPGQDPTERYRRDIVDYSLMSLRIAIERIHLPKLSKLTLSTVHPSAFTYLRHVPDAFGASPAAPRRWRQIRKLYISVESWDFYGPSPGLDQLKIIDDFIRQFAPTLDKFGFTWLGRKGPCPVALTGDPLFAPPRTARKLFHEVTSPMSPLPERPARPALVMPRLRYMQVRNATMNAPQLKALVQAHKGTVREFDFENVALIKGGSWEEALAPLPRSMGDGPRAGSDAWSWHSLGASKSDGSLRGPPAGGSAAGSFSGSSAAASSREEDQLPSPSAAAAAASKELFDVDLEGMVFGGANDVEDFEAGVEEWARGVTAAAATQDGPRTSEVIPEVVEEEQPAAVAEDDGGLASDIEAARQASLGFSTNIKKRRIRKKSHSHRHQHDGDGEEESARKSHHRHTSRSRHKHSRSDETHERHHRGSNSRHRSQSRRGDSRHASRHRKRHSEEDIPSIPRMPEVIGSDYDDDFETIRPSSSSRHKPPPPPLEISAPILNTDPLPVLLLPTIYDPSTKAGPFINNTANTNPASTSADTIVPLSTQPSLIDDGLSTAQRTIEAELLAEAEEAAARSSALKRAKEAVLSKLSREFCKRTGAGYHGTGTGTVTSYGNGTSYNRSSRKGDSAAVVASLSSLQLGMHANLPLTCGSSVGFRLREGLFGRSHPSGGAGVGGVGGGLSSLGLGQGGSSVIGFGTVTPDHRSLESRTALVPLMFSRS